MKRTAGHCTESPLTDEAFTLVRNAEPFANQAVPKQRKLLRRSKQIARILSLLEPYARESEQVKRDVDALSNEIANKVRKVTTLGRSFSSQREKGAFIDQHRTA